MEAGGGGEAHSQRLGEYALEEQAGGEEAIEGESQDLRVEVGADGAELDLALEVSGEQVQVGAGACQDGLTQLGDGRESQRMMRKVSRRARVSDAWRAARVCRSEG